MKGDNDGWTYEEQAKGIVKKDANGHYVGEYGWSDFKSSAPMSLSASSLSFRQSLSLDPAIQPSVPNLSQVQPFLIGPITDMLTFYSDLWIAMRQSNLVRSGDHTYVKFGGPVSWALEDCLTTKDDRHEEMDLDRIFSTEHRPFWRVRGAVIYPVSQETSSGHRRRKGIPARGSFPCNGHD